MPKKFLIAIAAMAAMLAMLAATATAATDMKLKPRLPRGAVSCEMSGMTYPKDMTNKAVLVMLKNKEGQVFDDSTALKLKQIVHGVGFELNAWAHPNCWTLMSGGPKMELCVIARIHFVPDPDPCPDPVRDKKTGWWTYIFYVKAATGMAPAEGDGYGH